MVAIAPNLSKSRKYSAMEHSFGATGGDFVSEAPGDLTLAGQEQGPENQETQPIIDLVHLSRQTLSDQALEVELLDLFERQSARIVAQLRETRAGAAKTRGDLAHTLRGSALAVGAGRVARIAQIYETRCAGAPEAAIAATLDALAGAVAEARATIAQLLDH
jgi:HPt (histidine-containing phosphotransfer) domain-containing protein